MRKIILMLVFCMIATCPVMAKTDRHLVKSYCKDNYKGYKVEYYKNLPFDTLVSRKGKKIVIVEILMSKSRGRSGRTAQGYYIKYNKKVKKGKTVKSYLIYNPHTNYEDDVVAVVDNKKIRW